MEVVGTVDDWTATTLFVILDRFWCKNTIQWLLSLFLFLILEMSFLPMDTSKNPGFCRIDRPAQNSSSFCSSVTICFLPHISRVFLARWQRVLLSDRLCSFSQLRYVFPNGKTEVCLMEFPNRQTWQVKQGIWLVAEPAVQGSVFIMGSILPYYSPLLKGSGQISYYTLPEVQHTNSLTVGTPWCAPKVLLCIRGNLTQSSVLSWAQSWDYGRYLTGEY